MNCTPGNWYAMVRETGGIVDQATICSDYQTDGEDTFLADTMGVNDEVPLEQRRANAFLFAASKDMLALLKFIASGIKRGKIDDHTILRRNGEEIETEALSAKIAEVVAKAEPADSLADHASYGDTR